MREIPLTRGYVVLVDAADCAGVSRRKWFAMDDGRGHVYAARQDYRNGPRRLVLMHRIIAGASVDQQVDHINGNTLDNRRANLRLCDRSENKRNQALYRNSTSGYKGVSWRKDRGKWRAVIWVDSRQTTIGLFACPIEAARAYDRKAIELHGAFARLNFPQE